MDEEPEENYPTEFINVTDYFRIATTLNRIAGDGNLRHELYKATQNDKKELERQYKIYNWILLRQQSPVVLSKGKRYFTDTDNFIWFTIQTLAATIRFAVTIHIDKAQRQSLIFC